VKGRQSHNYIHTSKADTGSEAETKKTEAYTAIHKQNIETTRQDRCHNIDRQRVRHMQKE